MPGIFLGKNYLGGVRGTEVLCGGVYVDVDVFLHFSPGYGLVRTVGV